MVAYSCSSEFISYIFPVVEVQQSLLSLEFAEDYLSVKFVIPTEDPNAAFSVLVPSHY